MNVGILTAGATRHRYFAQALSGNVNVVAVMYEDTGYSPANLAGYDLTQREREIVEQHFEKRSKQEEIFFGANSEALVDCPARRVRRIGSSELNSHDTLEFLKSAGVDTVVVYGTNLIKEPLLSAWPDRMINMHLGLSPYYRGTGTNFYPLLNGEPEYVGATIHKIDAGIDSGAIYKHARPDIAPGDMPHTIGCKAILAGIDTLVEVLKLVDQGAIDATPQWDVDDAKLYLRKDYHPRQVVELYEKLDEGLIDEYVKRAATVAPKVRLVE